jgi:hydroxymethylglutaryl-CoA reductase
MKTSAIPNFYNLSIDERIEIVKDFSDLSDEEVKLLKNLSTVNHERLNYLGENPVSNYELPLRIANYFKINDIDRFIPMVVEEASVVAGASSGAKLCYYSGGVQACVSETSEYGKIIGETQLVNVKNPKKAKMKILKEKNSLLKKANEGHRYSKAYELKVKEIEDMLIIDLYIDPGDAMGAAVASEMAERIAPELSKITGCNYNSNIVSNYSGRLTRAKLEVPIEDLGRKSKGGKVWKGEEVKDGIIKLSEWAEKDTYRATTHNKGIMNGVDAVAIATGQDWRAIESANHAFASREGKYKPLSTWYEEDDFLVGELEMLIPCGIVGGEIKNYPKAKLSLKIMKVRSADELAEIIGSVGLVQNLAALRMNATIGLKEGHEPHRRR